MASADILRAARARIEGPKNWTQLAFARDASGNEVDAMSEGAVCWCAYGAVHKETGELFSREGILLSKTAARLFKSGVATVNDFDGHESVLAMFDAAIAAAEAEAGR